MLAETVEEWTEQRVEQGLERGIEQGRAEERALLCRLAARKFDARHGGRPRGTGESSAASTWLSGHRSAWGKPSGLP